MVGRFITLSAALLVTSFVALCAVADVTDPLDPFDFDSSMPDKNDLDADEKKTAPELIQEAAVLMSDERLLDARSKLLIALKKDPKAYRAHLMLGGYYLVHVGHFRLALQYVKQAESIFSEINGSPPFEDIRVQAEHAQILYLISQARLNLDNYQGALDVLNQYTQFGYYDDWYPGTKAWILMKLGKLSEAIKVAQLGYAASSRESEKGQILNMLGILYSMNRQRAASLEIFRSAVAHELSMGSLGQPATPLNNAGEVYKEIFEEDKAESAWLRATSQPDGCEHVLPALNLAFLYIEALNLQGAKKAIDNFEACVAQYPLRNGEEHRALVNLARGRIDLYSGKVDSAIEHFDNALQRKQWFGKIGTSEQDLQAATMMSMAQALTRKKNQSLQETSGSITDWVKGIPDRAEYSLLSWWYMRRSRQILTEDLSNFEDLYIRSTDTLLEYPTLGELISGLPASRTEERIDALLRSDDRTGANPYYKSYLAEIMVSNGRISKARRLIQEVLNSVRRKYDDALKLRVLLLDLSIVQPMTDEYIRVANAAFALNRPALRAHGFRLPVNYSISDKKIIEALNGSPFLLDNNVKLQYVITGEALEREYVLQFLSQTGVLGNLRVKSSDLGETVRKLNDEIFVLDLK